MRDFTLDIYREMLEALLDEGYEIVGFAEYLNGGLMNGDAAKPLNGENGGLMNGERKVVILRHDVDAKPENSLKTAQIEHALGIKATYYFRAPEGGKVTGDGLQVSGDVIRAIVRLGHEIGYHYEDLSLCGGDAESAYRHFTTYLDYFRQYYPVETICMHGAPTSKWDNKDLWKRYDYKSLGIIGEPYMDTDFSDVFYLTDTGRCWDGYRVSVRDKIPVYQEEWTKQGLTWHTTAELIEAVKKGRMPKHVMITTHPQRWTNDKSLWFKELVEQKCKNILKRILLWKTRN